MPLEPGLAGSRSTAPEKGGARPVEGTALVRRASTFSGAPKQPSRSPPPPGASAAPAQPRPRSPGEALQRRASTSSAAVPPGGSVRSGSRSHSRRPAASPSQHSQISGSGGMKRKGSTERGGRKARSGTGGLRAPNRTQTMRVKPSGNFWDSYAEKVEGGLRREPLAPGALTLIGSMKDLGKQARQARAEAAALLQENARAHKEHQELQQKVDRHCEDLLWGLVMREGTGRAIIAWAQDELATAFAHIRRVTAPNRAETGRSPTDIRLNQELRELLQAECARMRLQIKRARGDEQDVASPRSPQGLYQIASVHEEAASLAETEAHVSRLEIELTEAQSALRALRAGRPAGAQSPSECRETFVTAIPCPGGGNWLLSPAETPGEVEAARWTRAEGFQRRVISDWLGDDALGVVRLGSDIELAGGSAPADVAAALCSYCGVPTAPPPPPPLQEEGEATVRPVREEFKRTAQCAQGQRGPRPNRSPPHRSSGESHWRPERPWAYAYSRGSSVQPSPEPVAREFGRSGSTGRGRWSSPRRVPEWLATPPPPIDPQPRPRQPTVVPPPPSRYGRCHTYSVEGGGGGGAPAQAAAAVPRLPLGAAAAGGGGSGGAAEGQQRRPAPRPSQGGFSRPPQPERPPRGYHSQGPSLHQR
eukprot:TRINITY_DN16749_c0_g1_i1.p1 TRINITY_DN16749_c0_g1~~TRINITY_DN16749_c0_g1_i1.p1  ORF type:complete len:680 (+),score=127.58 TRINITY_DN16749_c0_g1_i1:96-2042(+)